MNTVYTPRLASRNHTTIPTFIQSFHQSAHPINAHNFSMISLKENRALSRELMAEQERQ